MAATESPAAQLERTEQQITQSLQRIEANFVQCHDEAAQLLRKVQQHIGQVNRAAGASAEWAEFFSMFTASSKQGVESSEASCLAEHQQRQQQTPAGSAAPSTPQFQQAALQATPWVQRAPGDVSPVPATPSVLGKALHFSSTPSTVAGSTPSAPLPTLDAFVTPSAPTRTAAGATPGSVMPTPGAVFSATLPGFDAALLSDPGSNTSGLRAAFSSPHLMHASPAPDPPARAEFELAMFPAAFQSGTRALQLTELYSQFFGEDLPQVVAEDGQVLRAVQSEEQLGQLTGFSHSDLSLLLGVLAEHRLLAPLRVADVCYWHRIGR